VDAVRLRKPESQAAAPVRLVRTLESLTSQDRESAGGKAANLGAMIRAGLPAPRGFCVTTAAFRLWLDGCQTAKPCLDRLDQLDAERRDELQRTAAEARQNLAATPLPESVARAIVAAWRQHRPEAAFAVRSSATAEDQPAASFAGQHDTFLNVRGEAALLDAVRRCWVSLFADRAVFYRMKNHLPHRAAAMAVVVQEMVPAEAAGVLFTVDPSTGSARRMVIEGARGLGDALVSGKVSPDRLVLEKDTLRVIRRPASSQTMGCARDQAGQRRQQGVAGAEPAEYCLDEALARRLGKLARKVERLFGGPQDIEWAVAGDQVFLLQARPVTSISPAKCWEDRQVWTNLNTGEVAPDVMTPITWSMIRLLLARLFGSVFRLVGADITRAPAVGLVAGRIYFNANTGLAAMKPFSWMLRRIPNFAQALGGGQIEVHRQGLLDIPDENLPDLGFRWPKYILSWPWIVYDLIAHSPRRGDAWTLRIKARYDALARLDIESMSKPELAQSFDALLRSGFEGMDGLYLVTQGAALPLFQKACRDWLGDPDLTLGYRLFSALGGVPETEAGLALWRLAALAHADRQTECALLSEDDWPHVRAKLGHTEHGRFFLTAWEAFMAEHGHHGRGELELFNARWTETPGYILGVVRGYLRAIDQCSPLENQRRLAQEREQLTEQCRRRLKNPIKRRLFSRSLRRAQKLAVNREEWKNQAVRHIAVLRRILLALGERLRTEGVLAQADDIFFLEVAEMGPVSGGQAHFDVKAVIGERRKEYERNLTLAPPPVVIGRFDPNTQSAPAADTSAKVLQGIPVYPGTVAGPARVILRTDDHEQVLPGEILVAPFTDPAWTPYFVPAAGVVIEQGGILSHGSIIAREYGLPAVTNVGSATRIIRTGDLVQVDGDRGRVTVLERG
jgi:pyruvate,water dikinase